MRQKNTLAPSNTSNRVTRLMKTDGPRRAALTTTEILENVLSFLPPKNIFSVQRVCRQWKDVIDSSPAIQEKMFLRLQNKAPETWRLTEENDQPRMVKVPAGAIGDDVLHGDWYSHPMGSYYTPVTLNPFLRLRASCFTIDERLYRFVSEDAELRHRSQFGQHPSYMQTHITDPPCNFLVVTLVYTSSPVSLDFHSVFHVLLLKSDRPLTIGELIDKACHERGEATVLDKAAESRDILDTTLADAIKDLQEQHKSKIVLKRRVEIRGTDTLERRAAVPTASEWAAISSRQGSAV